MRHLSLDATFLRQLRYWSFHCLLNAMPSLGIALWWLELWQHPSAVAGLFAAIATFILLYATLTSLPGPLTDPSQPLSRALRMGAKIRGWISALSMLLLPTGILMIFTPDYWAGLIAIGLLNSVVRFFGSDQPFFDSDTTSNTAGFFPVYLTTMLEGILLSFFLLMIAFFALLAVQAMDRRKGAALISTDSPARLR
jgi:hypothetical protein